MNNDDDDKKPKGVDLSEFMIQTDAHGYVSAADALADLQASKGFAPKAWQSHAPDTSYESRCMPVQDSPDLQRILALPRRPQVEAGTDRANALIDLMTRRYSRGNTTCECAEVFTRFDMKPRPCITSLNLAQSWALFELRIAGGLFGPIGVGHGKTILSLLSPLAIPNCHDAVLLMPPTLVGQLVVEYELLREHFRVPSLAVHGSVVLPGHKESVPYTAIAPEDHAPTLHVFPYSRLSRPESTVKLDEIAPDFIFADEVHNLRHLSAARAARVKRYIDGGVMRGNPIRFAGVSGSITDSSIKDEAHLALWALGVKSPLPLDEEVTADWARALDPKLDEQAQHADPYSPWSKAAPPGALLQLCDEGEHVSRGFYRRLVETHGVVATASPAVTCELEIAERKAPALPYAIDQALATLRDTWMRPDGEELLDALSVARCARELACGFHYYWHFPHVNGRPQEIADILHWTEIRKLYRKEMRAVLNHRREYLDSPHLVEKAARRFHGDLPIPPCPKGTSPAVWEAAHPMWDSEYWPEWRDVRNTVVYETRAERIDPYLVDDAIEWAREYRGIVWYDANEFGQWVAERGDLVKHGGGPDAGKLIAQEKGDRSIVCSIKSHGTGRDGLQLLFHEALVAQPPSSATAWEQMLGRLHRIRQRAPVVRHDFYRHTPELCKHVDTALARALYVQTTLGSEQKLRTGFIGKAAIEAAGRAARTPLDLDAILDEEPDDEEIEE